MSDNESIEDVNIIIDKSYNIINKQLDYDVFCIFQIQMK